jgi:hypothetical protein
MGAPRFSYQGFLIKAFLSRPPYIVIPPLNHNHVLVETEKIKA